MTTLGKRIAAHRKQNHYTQEDLAIKLNVSSQAVSKWENDLSIPDLSLLIELSSLFNISLDQLVKDDQMPTTYYMPETSRKPIDEMVVKISVLSAGGDKVKVNLPVIVIKACLESGMPIMTNGNSDTIRNIDFEQIFKMIEQGAIGTLVEVESEAGDHVTISVQ